MKSWGRGCAHAAFSISALWLRAEYSFSLSAELTNVNCVPRISSRARSAFEKQPWGLVVQNIFQLVLEIIGGCGNLLIYVSNYIENFNKPQPRPQRLFAKLRISRWPK